MSFCHIFILSMCFSVVFIKLIKGSEMSLVIKNAESLFEKFENSIEKWAEKLF